MSEVKEERGLVLRLLHIDDSAQSIALGTAIGMFIAMTPTVGFQMILVLIVCAFVPANRLAGLVTVYISNPLTLVPIYYVDYLAGGWTLGKEGMEYEEFVRLIESALSNAREAGILAQFYELFGFLGREFAGPMMLGGALIGLVLAIPTYALLVSAIRSHRRRHPKVPVVEGAEAAAGNAVSGESLTEKE
ncbi:MAG TPA: DUF2062 domain-containing protein [Planctomycetes bacterium]|nr:DUF2062 domain-containing protein [Planctomycetota bacterium]HIN80715.1 DUF2062 domain-containing protein [Planctomycetota bacterium]